MIKTYFSFSGRLSRKQFWLRFNAWTVTLWFGLRFFTFSYPVLGAQIQGILFFVLLWPTLAVLTKRMHDRGWPAYYPLSLFIIGFVLIVAAELVPEYSGILRAAGFITNAIVYIDAQFIPGQSGINRYGPDPLAGQRWDGSMKDLPATDLRRPAPRKQQADIDGG